MLHACYDDASHPTTSSTTSHDPTTYPCHAASSHDVRKRTTGCSGNGIDACSGFRFYLNIYNKFIFILYVIQVEWCRVINLSNRFMKSFSSTLNLWLEYSLASNNAWNRIHRSLYAALLCWNIGRATSRSRITNVRIRNFFEIQRFDSYLEGAYRYISNMRLLEMRLVSRSLKWNLWFLIFEPSV